MLPVHFREKFIALLWRYKSLSSDFLFIFSIFVTNEKYIISN